MKKNNFKKLLNIYVTFFKLGCFSFGGGYAMLSLIEHEVVEEKEWIDKDKIVDLFAVAGSLPGAIGLNSSAFVGYSVAGIPGAVIAILGNLTPSVFIVLILSIIFSKINNNPIVRNVFYGIRPAVIGLIAYAGVKIGKTAVIDKITLILAVIAFILSTFLHVSIVIIILLGAISGNIISIIKSKKIH